MNTCHARYAKAEQPTGCGLDMIDSWNSNQTPNGSTHAAIISISIRF